MGRTRVGGLARLIGNHEEYFDSVVADDDAKAVASVTMIRGVLQVRKRAGCSTLLLEWIHGCRRSYGYSSWALPFSEENWNPRTAIQRLCRSVTCRAPWHGPKLADEVNPSCPEAIRSPRSYRIQVRLLRPRSPW